MTVRKIRDAWYVDIVFAHASGRTERVRRRSPVQTKAGATTFELQVRRELLEDKPPVKEVPTLAAFVPDYLRHCAATNRASYARQKARTFATELLPAFGHLRLDEITVRVIDAYRAGRVGARTCTCCGGTGSLEKKRYPSASEKAARKKETP